jgi:hypothetical protein
MLSDSDEQEHEQQTFDSPHMSAQPVDDDVDEYDDAGISHSTIANDDFAFNADFDLHQEAWSDPLQHMLPPDNDDDDPNVLDPSLLDHYYYSQTRKVGHVFTVSPIDSPNRPMVKVTIGKTTLSALADSGADISIISYTLVQQIDPPPIYHTHQLDVKFGNQSSITTTCYFDATLLFPTFPDIRSFHERIYVADLPAVTFILSFGCMLQSGLGTHLFPSTTNVASALSTLPPPIPDEDPYTDLVSDILPDIADEIPSDDPVYELPDISHIDLKYRAKYAALIHEFRCPMVPSEFRHCSGAQPVCLVASMHGRVHPCSSVLLY